MVGQHEPRYALDVLKAVFKLAVDHRGGLFLGKIQMAGLFDLYPAGSGYPEHLKWPKKWPGSDSPGVYIVMDASLRVLYVGKASMNSCIGKRLSCHFQGSGGEPKLVENWSEPSEERRIQLAPRFIMTLALPQDLAFEAPAIEEYLIGELDPPVNLQGRLSKVGQCRD